MKGEPMSNLRETLDQARRFLDEDGVHYELREDGMHLAFSAEQDGQDYLLAVAGVGEPLTLVVLCFIPVRVPEDRNEKPIRVRVTLSPSPLSPVYLVSKSWTESGD